MPWTLEENFWENKRVAKNKCWIWTKYKDEKGYGIFRYRGQLAKAHRISDFC